MPLSPTASLPKCGAFLLAAGGLLFLGTALSSPTLGAGAPSPIRVTVPGAPAKRRPASPQLVQTSAVVRAPQARREFEVDGSGLTCALLDTGARITHVDFRGRVVATRNFTEENGGDLADVTDGDGHGTNAAGIVAANEVHTGIAPGAGLAVVKVLNNNGVGTSTMIGNGLQWVIDNHAALKISVVNMSLGNGQNYQSLEEYEAEHPNDPGGVRAKIQTLRALKIPVVVAVGNGFAPFEGRQGMAWPAIFPETISVGATYDSNVGRDALGGAIAETTRRDRITPYAQRLHPSVNNTEFTDIFAPGALVTSSGRGGDRASSTFHGTSESTPVVSGVIMLIQQYLQRQTGSLPTVDQLEQWLRESAVTINDGDDEDDNVRNTGLNFLRVDALRALQEVPLENPEPEPGQLRVTPRRLDLFARRQGQVRLQNIGDSPITASLSTLLGPSPHTENLQITPSGPFTIQGGGSALVTVRLQRRPRRRFTAEMWVHSSDSLPPNDVGVAIRVAP